MCVQSALADVVRDTQERLYPELRELGPSGFMVFWEVFADKAPILVVREAARPRLGNHPRWREILPHLFVPHDDLLFLVDAGAGDLIAFARERNELRPPSLPWQP